MDRHTNSHFSLQAPKREPVLATLDDDARAYYLANQEGIDSWNAYVAEHGLPLAEYSDF